MADELVLHEAEVREFIGRLAGVIEVLEGIPGFLKGDNDEGQTIWLTKVELGNHEPFETAWDEICGYRMKEAKDIADFLQQNRKKLIKAAELITHTDMDSAALFPTTTNDATGEETSLETSVERHGMDVRTPDEETVDRLGRNVPE